MPSGTGAPAVRATCGVSTANFLELLQELRVAQTGVQILFAFMLGLAFTPRFAALATSQHAIYLVTLVSAAASAALLIAPVSYHRTVFRRRLKAQLVDTAHRYAIAGLVLVLLALIGALDLAASLLLDGWAGLLAAALCVLFATLWFGVPLRHRDRYKDHRSLTTDRHTSGRRGQASTR
jgi:membrane protein implicated in regulation of membrane protease activity